MTYQEAYNTTIAEYEVYKKAFAIKIADKSYLLAKSAWYSQSVKETKGKGKSIRPKYQNFNDFFDWESEIESVFDPLIRERKEFSKADVNKLMNEYIKLHKGGGG